VRRAQNRESEQAIALRKVEIIDDIDKEQRNGMRRRFWASDGHGGLPIKPGSNPIVDRTRRRCKWQTGLDLVSVGPTHSRFVRGRSSGGISTRCGRL